MSSIGGVFWRDGKPVEPAEIENIVARLAHWGPDAIGHWRGGGAALAQLTLWSTPEAQAENAPVRDPAGVVVAADARIDNRAELCAQLGLRDNAGGVGDVELIARAYVKWGDECPSHLIGDFAFAIWDERRQRLFCARDPMGVRPFFYFVDARRFRFGSEIKAIFVDPEVPRDLNRLQLAVALAGLPSFDDQTAFKAVRGLEPASALAVDAAGFRVWKYWRLEMGREITLPSDDDYADAFEEVLQRAVQARLRSTGRVGSLLSGGLDATTCLGLAMRAGAPASDRMVAFSWALRKDDDWWVPDERPFIEAFLAEHPIEHAYIHSDPARLFDLPPAMRRHRDGPEWRADHIQMLPTFEEAQRRGVRVLLHGVGGDETVSYAALDFPAWCLLTGNVAALNAEAKAFASARRMSRLRAVRQLFSPWLDPTRWRAPFNYLWTYRRRCERVADLSELGIPLAGSAVPNADLRRYVREVSRPRLRGAWHNPLRADQIYLLTQTHVISDQIAAWDYAASYGIECRCPYLDRRVVEFAVAVPPTQHRLAGINRRLLRRVALRTIPAKIARRRDKSATMPDLARMVCMAERALQARIKEWRGDPRVTEVVDLDRLAEDLRQVCADAKAQSPSWSPVLPFCRGVFVATYLSSA